MGKDLDIGIPQPFELDVDADVSTNNSIALSPISIDMGLDNVNVEMDSNLNINGSMDMGLDNVNVNMGLDNINVDMGLDNVNMCMSFAIKELPSMKMHFPINLDFGIKVLGIPLLNFGICGKAMVVTEDNPKKVFYTPKHASFKASKASIPAKDSIKVSIAEG